MKFYEGGWRREFIYCFLKVCCSNLVFFFILFEFWELINRVLECFFFLNVILGKVCNCRINSFG